MSSFLTYLALLVMIVTAGVLLAGLFNMMRGGSGNTSQKLMRARVMLQGLAVILIVGVLLLAKH
ncbi:twin transmembrane helix small protein [Jiella mangrovi]|uniref:Twin transmembrane helix small protein n=1 Tax=Jiella mangrovi TaxID=2821407 RepID=A0ABS4BDM4_9HYPH|nr:twin transmembrane helix small protein [Jiella mangrovi]MBP0614075.1 twin transmembrane helix small protein [Jiella mangrovi]